MGEFQTTLTTVTNTPINAVDGICIVPDNNSNFISNLNGSGTFLNGNDTFLNGSGTFITNTVIEPYSWYDIKDNTIKESYHQYTYKSDDIFKELLGYNYKENLILLLF